MKQVSEGMKGASYPGKFSLTEMAVKLLPSASYDSTICHFLSPEVTKLLNLSVC